MYCNGVSVKEQRMGSGGVPDETLCDLFSTDRKRAGDMNVKLHQGSGHCFSETLCGGLHTDQFLYLNIGQYGDIG
jgi:hypothetical protein